MDSPFVPLYTGLVCFAKDGEKDFEKNLHRTQKCPAERMSAGHGNYYLLLYDVCVHIGEQNMLRY